MVGEEAGSLHGIGHQVVRVFLFQHLAFAVLGVAAGSAATALLGSRIPGRIGEAAGAWRELPGHAALLLGVPGAALLLIATATGLAARRAGKVSPVPAARAALPVASRLTVLGRRALGWHVPPALVLGWRAAFPRRARALVQVARLALPLLMITVALGAWTTLEESQEAPERLGLQAGLTARSEQAGAADDGSGERRRVEALEAHPDVTAAYPGIEVSALVPGQTGTSALRGLGTAGDRYPFAVVEGRALRGRTRPWPARGSWTCSASRSATGPG